MDRSINRKRCSFCGEPGIAGERTVAGGLGAFICEQCAAHHHHTMSTPENLKRNVDAGPPWERMTTTELLATIPRIAATAVQVEEFLVEWVELTRSRGASWAEIGKVLGVSRQAAWERFARRVEKVREDRELTAGA